MTSPSHRATRILATASELFVRYGVAKTTVEDIARAAGVSKGAVYLEFDSKDHLFAALVRWEFRGYLADLRARVMADPQGGRLSRIYRHGIDLLLSRPLLRALYTRDAEVLGAMVRREGADRYAPRALLGRDFVSRMQAAGLVRADLSPDLLGYVITLLSIGPLMAEPVLRDGHEPPFAQTADLLATMLVASVEVPRGDVEAGKQAFAALCQQLDEAVAQ